MPMEQTLTGAEWNVMECLWECAPRTGREAAQWLQEHAGWSRSTTLTMLRRMTQKGLLQMDDSGGRQTYVPLLDRAQAVREETGRFLDRVYQGSLSLLVSTLVRDRDLTEAEREELLAILARGGEVSED
mgnify:CR=1 FL=1